MGSFFISINILNKIRKVVNLSVNEKYILLFWQENCLNLNRFENLLIKNRGSIEKNSYK